VDSVDNCCLIYNCAVLLYHTKQYRAALNVLEKLLPYIDPIEDTTVQKVVLLLTELYLCTNLPQMSLEMLVILDKSYVTSDKASSDKDDSSEKSGRSGSTEPQIDANKALLCQLRVRCYLMLKSIKLAKKELKSLISCSEPSTSLLFIKAQFEAFRSNYQKSLRILNSSPQLGSPAESPTTTPGTWGQTLGTAGGTWEQSVAAAMYYNNVSVGHFYQRKPHLALFYLRKAMEENCNAARDSRKAGVTGQADASSIPLNRLRSNRYYELTYNLGVQTLHTGQPQAAFDYLLEVVQVYHANPRLWLRLAECCIMCHRQSNDEDRRLKKKIEVINCAVGSGIHRKLILGSGAAVDSSGNGNEAAIPVATMEFASLCLDNALLLLPDSVSASVSQSAQRSDSTSTQDTAADSQPAGISLVAAPPGHPMRSEEVENLRCSALAARSYVALYHNDHLVALHCAEQLLRQPRLSGAHRYLAHLYSAEALVTLDQISTGIDHLNPESITDVSTVFPSSSPSTSSGMAQQGSTVGTTSTSVDKPDDVYEPRGAQLFTWLPADVRPAKAIATYNLATAYAIRGEHDKALHHLSMSTQDAGQPLPAQMYYLKIYLELTEGRRKLAQSFIRDQFGHMTLNRQ
jgi:CCR4-NOT transcription complex subunit 10